MDIKNQYTEFAFGGKYVEDHLAQHAAQEMLSILVEAARQTTETDLRRSEPVFMALEYVELHCPKGPAYAAGFRSALDIADQALRFQEVTRYLKLIRAWVTGA